MLRWIHGSYDQKFCKFSDGAAGLQQECCAELNLVDGSSFDIDQTAVNCFCEEWGSKPGDEMSKNY